MGESRCHRVTAWSHHPSAWYAFLVCSHRGQCVVNCGHNVYGNALNVYRYAVCVVCSHMFCSLCTFQEHLGSSKPCEAKNPLQNHPWIAMFQVPVPGAAQHRSAAPRTSSPHDGNMHSLRQHRLRPVESHVRDEGWNKNVVYKKPLVVCIIDIKYTYIILHYHIISYACLGVATKGSAHVRSLPPRQSHCSQSGCSSLGKGASPRWENVMGNPPLPNLTIGWHS